MNVWQMMEVELFATRFKNNVSLFLIDVDKLYNFVASFSELKAGLAVCFGQGKL